MQGGVVVIHVSEQVRTLRSWLGLSARGLGERAAEWIVPAGNFYSNIDLRCEPGARMRRQQSPE